MSKVYLLRKEVHYSNHEKCKGCYFGPHEETCKGVDVNRKLMTFDGFRPIECYKTNGTDYMFIKITKSEYEKRMRKKEDNQCPENNQKDFAKNSKNLKQKLQGI